MSSTLTLGLDAARTADPARFAIGGVAPRLALRPGDREELAEALRAAARDRLAIVPWGGGVSLAHRAAPSRYDVAVDLRGLDRLVEYQPEDMTLTAECGVTLATLRQTLAARGQELPLEGAFAERATLGGVLAANASGPRRLRFGSPRDRILGARYALADGTLARAGGKVVKNVAGYGIHRLLCGSLGGLAIVVEASLKLAPAPARRAALVYTMDATRLADRGRWAFLPRLEPAAVTVLGCEAAHPLGLDEDDRFMVVIGLEEDAPWLEQQVDRIEEAMGDASVRRLDHGAAAALWPMLCDLEEQEGPRLTFASPSDVPAAVAPLLGRREARRLVFHAPAGRLHVFPDGKAAPELVQALAGHGFTLIEASRVAALDPPQAPQVAVAMLRERLRTAFDPDGRMALGDAPTRVGRPGPVSREERHG